MVPEFKEYKVTEEIPVRAERFQIKNLQLEDIIYDKVTIPSLALTVKLKGIDTDKWLFNPVQGLIAFICSGGKTIWLPADPERYVNEIAYHYLYGKFGKRMIKYHVMNAEVEHPRIGKERPLPERFNRLHRASMTIEGIVVYYE